MLAWWMAQGVDLSKYPANGALAWGALVAAILIPSIPAVLALLKDRSKTPPKPPEPAPVEKPSVTAAVDSAAALVREMAAEMVADIREERNAAIRELRSANRRISDLESEVAELRAQVAILRRQHTDRGPL